MITLRKQLDCAQRELALRHSVYPVWTEKRRITSTQAEHELAAMAAIIGTLEKLVMLEEVSEEMRGRGGNAELGTRNAEVKTKTGTALTNADCGLRNADSKTGRDPTGNGNGQADVTRFVTEATRFVTGNGHGGQ